jgi:predicted nucleic acid-binding protein
VLEKKTVVVDTNVLFSALLGSSSNFAHSILTTDHSYWICESIIVELFKHKEKIVQHSRLSEDDIARLYYRLLDRLNIFKEALIELPYRQDAYRLCKGIDETDAPQVALTMQLGGLLWTGDQKLKRALRDQGFDQFFEPE